MSVRGLMVLVLLSGGLVGWYVHEVSTRRAAWATITAAGGKISFRDQDTAAAGGWTWLYRRTGGDFCREVVSVLIQPLRTRRRLAGEAPPPPSFEAVCAAIRRQGRCESVTILGGPVTAAGLAELAEARIDKLDLRIPGLTADQLVQIRRMHGLKKITLEPFGGGDFPPLSELVATVAALPQLESVRLQSFLLDGDLAPLGSLTGLRELNIITSPDGERWLAVLDPLTQLRDLRVGNLQVTDAGLARLAAAHPRLRLLACDGVLINDQGIEALARSGNLEELDLNGLPAFPPYRVTKPRPDHPGRLTDASLIALGRCRSLRTLELDHGHFTGTGLGALGGLPLRSLSLDAVSEAGSGLARMLAGRTFDRVELHGPGVTDTDLPALAGRLDPADGWLDLSETAVTDAGMPALAGINLGWMSLDETRITDRGLATLGTGLTAKALSVNGTDVTPAGAAAFSAAHPKIILFYEPPSRPRSPRLAPPGLPIDPQPPTPTEAPR